MIKTSRLAATVLLAVGALCLPAHSASAQPLAISDGDSPSPNPRCENEGDLIANPDDAGSFFHCSHEVAYLKDCPSILHFNPELKVCDWPENANNPAGPYA
ncbi:carbohydrate-binding module family 14 protein [Streptomyces virginiae]|uniref:carbohydrate-binding module family 14 protein n=1 Tax=Streptomyces virginiae TaxID=1961 RepID=UPI00324A2A43